jgi:hypothetical protein
VLALAKLRTARRSRFWLANSRRLLRPLLLQFERSVAAGFTPAEVPALLDVADSIPALVAGLDAAFTGR